MRARARHRRRLAPLGGGAGCGCESGEIIGLGVDLQRERLRKNRGEHRRVARCGLLYCLPPPAAIGEASLRLSCKSPPLLRRNPRSHALTRRTLSHSSDRARHPPTSRPRETRAPAASKKRAFTAAYSARAPRELLPFARRARPDAQHLLASRDALAAPSPSQRAPGVRGGAIVAAVAGVSLPERRAPPPSPPRKKKPPPPPR